MSIPHARRWKNYNDGKRIAQRIEVPALKRADLIYTGKGAAVVVRREAADSCACGWWVRSRQSDRHWNRRREQV
jgi:hypothetical protein